jgi:hypothetical protein
MADFTSPNSGRIPYDGPEEEIIELTDPAEEEEAIIELTDRVETGEETFEPTGAVDGEDSVIDLVDRVEENGDSPVPAEMGENAGTVPASGPGADVPESARTALPVVSEEELRAMVTRLVEEKYAQTIEPLLREAVLQVLEKEIAALRKRILGEPGGGETC